MGGNFQHGRSKAQSSLPTPYKGSPPMQYFNIQTPKEYLLTFVGYMFGLRKYEYI